MRLEIERSYDGASYLVAVSSLQNNGVTMLIPQRSLLISILLRLRGSNSFSTGRRADQFEVKMSLSSTAKIGAADGTDGNVGKPTIKKVFCYGDSLTAGTSPP